MDENKATAPRFYWKGTPSTDMTREELLDLVDYLANQLAEYRTPSAISLMAIGRVEAIRRGSRPLSSRR